MNHDFTRRTGIACLVLLLAGATRAQENAPTGANNAAPKISLSAVSNPSKRGKWQERLTLGAGDTLDFSLLELPDLARKGVVIGPDGRVTYLQAENIMAAGLTVDELRAKFDEELGRFYRSPRTLITPVAYKSKKYFILGSVANKGVYQLNRPTTVIEAIAQAGGLEIGMYERSTVELADLGRSFLVREGKRVTVDFEQLFQRGDLTQNVAIEPNDYLYFASAAANEIYVLGEVAIPGVVAFAQRATVISVVSSRGGFTDKAFKSRVLVIRGSLDKPQTFVVDVSAILAAKKPDFKLEPKDMVYISANPWLIPVDIIDAAARAFMQGMIVHATSQNIGPLITTPIIR